MIHLAAGSLVIWSDRRHGACPVTPTSLPGRRGDTPAQHMVT